MAPHCGLSAIECEVLGLFSSDIAEDLCIGTVTVPMARAMAQTMLKKVQSKRLADEGFISHQCRLPVHDIPLSWSLQEALAEAGDPFEAHVDQFQFQKAQFE